MELQTQIVPLRLDGSLAGRSDEDAVEYPQWKELDDVQFDKAGAIRTRNGFANLPGFYLDQALDIKNVGGVLTALCNGSIWQRSGDRGNYYPVPRLGRGGQASHPFVPIEITERAIVSSAEGFLDWDIAHLTPYTGMVWIEGDTSAGTRAFLAVYDADGVVVMGPFELEPDAGSIEKIKICSITGAGVGADQDHFVAVMFSDTGNAYACALYNVDGVIEPGSFESLGSYSTCNIVASGASAFAVLGSGSAIAVLELSVSNQAITIDQTTTFVGDGSRYVAATYAEGVVYVLYSGAGTKLAKYDPSANAFSYSEQQVYAGDTRCGALKLRESLLIILTEDFDENVTIETAVKSTGAAAGDATVYYGHTMTGELGSLGSLYNIRESQEELLFAAIERRDDSTLPNGMIAVLDYNNPPPIPIGSIGRFGRDLARRNHVNGGDLEGQSISHMVDIDDGKAYRFVYRALRGDEFLRWVDVRLLPSYGETPPSAESSGVLYIGGGQLWSVDKQAPTECAPHWYPEGVAITMAGSGGSLGAGDYAYKIVYSWTDGAGNIHRSAPSIAETATAVSNDQATIEFEQLSIRARDGETVTGVRVELFRTEAGGSIYYRVGVYRSSELTVNASGKWEIVDDASDTSLISNSDSALYTDSGELSAEPPPPSSDLLVAKGRMWLIDSTNKSTVWYSKRLTEGYAPEWNTGLTIRFPEELVALAEMDGTLIAFSENRTYIVSGDGPNDAGVGGAFSLPRAVLQDLGCIDRRTVCQGPFGVLFLSRRGIFALDRSLAPQFVGAPVDNLIEPSDEYDDYDADTHRWRFAQLVPDETEVRLGRSYDRDSTTYYEQLVWNYLTNQWSRWTGFDAFTGSCVFGGKQCLAQDNDIAQEGVSLSSAETNDPSSVRIRTGWIGIGGNNTYQRIRHLLFRVRNAATSTFSITVNSYYDGDWDTATEEVVRTSAQIADAGDNTVGVPITEQTCSRIALEIVVDTFGGADARAVITHPSIEVGVKKGRNKLPAVQVG